MIQTLLFLIYRSKCGPGNWVKIGSINPLASCPCGFTSANIGGAQVCWKSNTGCASFSFNPAQRYKAVCGAAAAYAYGSPDAFSHSHSSTETINQAYVDGISITHGSLRHHVFTYAATNWLGDCPCKGGKLGPSFVGNNSYCGDQVLASGEHWTQKWYPNTILWHAAIGCTDSECYDDFRPWFSVETANGATTDLIEVRSCQDQGYPDEAIGIAHLEIYVRVD